MFSIISPSQHEKVCFTISTDLQQPRNKRETLHKRQKIYVNNVPQCPLAEQPSYFDQHFSSFRSSLKEGSLYQGSPENNIATTVCELKVI